MPPRVRLLLTTPDRPPTLRHPNSSPSTLIFVTKMTSSISPRRSTDIDVTWELLANINDCAAMEEYLAHREVDDPLLLSKRKCLVDTTVKASEEHRRLRAALSVGFSTAAVRGYQPVFQKVAEILSGQLEQSTAEATNVCPLLSTATLGAISEAILGRSLQDLGQDFVENNIKIVELSASQSKAQILADAIGAHFPAWFWRAVMYLPTKSFKVIRRQGLDINNDFFGLLVTDTLEKTKKELSEDDIRSQTGIILVAGQETTANTMAFGLLELARHPDFQDKLRAEIYSNPRTGVKDVGYDNMPLLNAFIKETLRLYPAQPLSDRIALQDTVIPLGDSITSTGQQITQISVQKGQLVTLAIGSYQRLESRWGKDAHEFNPFRWLGGASYQGEALGPYANLLSFFGGPRTCLG
ncbi:cytochrome P450 [Mycena latifolia]|nr:cytochrome P450 [Mycena latifolia]